MYASKKYNKLILQTKYAAQLKALMPEAQLSQEFPNHIYIPWDIAHCMRLASLGFVQIPSLLAKEYIWAGGKTPYMHQQATADFCILNPRGFILNGLGSGKTHSVLWAADYLMRIGAVKKVLIVCNVSTLDVVWGDTLFYDFYHRKFAVLTGSAKRRCKLFAADNIDFYVINHDAFGIIKEQYLARTDIDLIIIDEATAYKNPSTNRFKRFRKALDDRPPKYMWALTAEPRPNEPTDVWGPSRLLQRNQGISQTAFKDLTMRKVATFTWVERDDAHKYVAKLLSPSIRFATRDCIDLPETIYSTRKATLSPQQHKAFTSMVNQFVVEFSDAAANAVNEADKQNKLLQIACGFIYSRDEGNQVVTQHIDPSARLAVLDEILESVQGKAIIFVPYTELIEIIKKHLTEKTHRQCRTVYGATSKAERYEIFTDFQTKQFPDIIIAHPKTMAHGITLTAAATIIWYAPYASNEFYSQANGRIVRPSQTKVTNIVHIVATTLEQRIYAKLAKRQSTQGTLLDYMKEVQNGRSND